ncbi:Cytochrome c [Maioricimonas rarisocia]|uniref:Cytochrome c n=1 Tax=Maioricimonas rarisocia TaxID=2528026 RepID=A0A517Z9W2_9PLAN|nr:PVC-type heme-binding CxxCH protein [Maioricimonas rarisocia]QDU39278.1 Cytochrome c [Maioricimonas rarisocia]
MMPCVRRAALTLLLLALPALPSDTTQAAGSPAPPDTQEETIEPLSPAQALAALRVPEGFEATLFAAEPDVRNPIAVSTDSRGRLWVAENFTYAERPTNFDLSLKDRILILEDTDGDGVHDRHTVFWDQGQKLTSIAVGFGGVWATCAPHLLFIPDRDGDDVPDGPPEIILDGFDADSVRHNIVNGLKWGPDGWLYGRHGILATSRVGHPGAADSERTPINCGVWRYHPTRKQFEVVSHGTTNPWGMDWDEHGECWLINTVIGHLWHVVPGAHWERMYGSDFNPHLYDLLPQTADHVHWDEGERWSDIREGMSGTTDAAGGGHAHCGLLYCDASWPKEYRGSLLAGNLHGRRLNRDTLHRHGSTYIARHAPDFLFSDDPYFRVIEMEHAPQTGMFVVDWSDIGECHENDGVHRSSGRIFLIRWTETDDATATDLAALSDNELVKLQRQPREWPARTARRILQERAVAGRDMEAAATALRELTKSTDSVLVLRGLWGLHVTNTLSAADIRSALTHKSEFVRTWGVRLAAEYGHLPADGALAARFTNLAQEDSSGLVRHYLASTLSRFAPQQRMPIALALAGRQEDADDPRQALMIWYGIEDGITASPEGARQLLQTAALPALPQYIARRLTHEIETTPELTAVVVDVLAATPEDDTTRVAALLTGMSEALRGWQKAPMPGGWSKLAKRLGTSEDENVRQLSRDLSLVFGDGRTMQELRKLARAGDADPAARQAAIRSLVTARAPELEPMLVKFLQDRDVAAEAIRGLAVVGGADTPKLIVSNYGRFRDAAREEAITALVSRPAFAPVLLDAVASGRIPAEAVPTFQVRQMLTFGDAGLTARIEELFPDITRRSQKALSRISQLREMLTDTTLAAGDRSHGRKLFQDQCAKCHRLFGTGGTTAPDLTGAQRTNLNYLLENIVDPSATVSKNYRMSVVLLEDGRVLNGVVTNETDRTITLQTPQEAMVLPLETIEERRQTDLSLMPEGQLDRLGDDDVRDLFSYLMSPSQVALPAETKVKDPASGSAAR